MLNLIFLLKLSKLLLRTIIFHILFGPPQKSWNLKFHLVIKLIKETITLNIGKDLKKFRALNSRNPLIRLNNCRLELGHVPDKFRLVAEGIVKEFCVEEYGEYFAPEDHNWSKAKQLEIHTITPTKLKAKPTKTFYYFHGGALLFGSPKTYYSILSKLSNLSGCQAIAIDYRKCPEVTVLSCVEDIVAGWLYITSPVEDGGLGIVHSQVVVGGDSAGGGLAAKLGYFLKKTNRPNSAGLLLWSPSLDMTKSQPSIDSQAEWDTLPTSLDRDEFIGNQYNLRGGFNRMAYYGSSPDIQRRLEEYGSYIAPKHALKWPLISSMLSEDLTNLPPHLIMVGGAETLRDENVIYSKRLWNMMKDKNYEYDLPPVVLQVYDEMPHVFMIIPFYPRLNLVIKRSSNFLISCFNSSEEPKLDYNIDDVYLYKANSIDEIDYHSQFFCYKQLPKCGLYKYVPEYEESKYEVWESKLTQSLPDLSRANKPKKPKQKAKRKQSKSK